MSAADAGNDAELASLGAPCRPPGSPTPIACGPGLYCETRFDCGDSEGHRCASASCSEATPTCGCGGVFRGPDRCADSGVPTGCVAEPISADGVRLREGLFAGRGMRLEITQDGGRAVLDCGTALLDEVPAYVPCTNFLAPSCKPFSWRGRYFSSQNDAGPIDVLFRGGVPVNVGHIPGATPSAIGLSISNDAGTVVITRLFKESSCGGCHAHYFQDGGNVGPCP